VAYLPLKIKLPQLGSQNTQTLAQTLQKHDLTIVQFWASWCVGCGEMMVELLKRRKSESALGYIAISIDEDMATAERYFKTKNQDVKAAMPDTVLDEAGDRVATPLGITTLPYLVIAGKDGRILDRIEGHPKPSELSKRLQNARKK